MEQAQGEFRIGLDDVLEVSVWHDGDVSRIVPVRPDGKISLPLVGEVMAAGRTAHEVQGEIAERLAPYVEHPHVAVIVKEIHSQRFFVMGQVTHPGAFAFQGPTTVVQALAEAGGLGEFAEQNSIVLLRHAEDGVHRYSLRYDDLVEGADKRAVYLAPGDTLVVP
ncbi:MAG: polysaccharide biosynthesis/export family protein [Deltaproteobacteria bacterium]